MTQALAPAPAEIQAEASKLVDAICNKLEDAYVRGHLDIENLTTDRLCAYYVNEEQTLEDALAERDDRTLDKAVLADLDHLIGEYQQRAREDEAEHRFKMTCPYAYGAY